MITDISILRTALSTGYLPPSITGADPAKLQRLGVELTLQLGEGREAIEENERIRAALVAFGALDPTDQVTGLADLIDVLLPPSEA